MLIKRIDEWTTDLDWELKIWNKHFRSGKKLNQKLEKFYPPNMTLNLGPYTRQSSLWALSICGVILQGAVIMVAGLTTFYSPNRNCFHSRTWPFYVFTIGTGFLFLGLVECAAGIDRASQDVLWEPHSPNLLVIWLQEGYEQDGIGSYVLTKRIKDGFVSSHRPRDAQPVVKFPPLIIFLITVGFLMQATGLPAMHWPPQLLQFLATVIMFFSRSFLRRQDAPDCAKKIRGGCCKDWIAKMCVLDSQNLYRSPSPDDPDITWKMAPLTIDKQNTGFGGCKCAQNLLAIRRFLASATQDEGQHTILASSLASTVSQVTQVVFNAITGWTEVDRWQWELDIRVDRQVSETLELAIDKTENEWRADEKELEAVISLLLSSHTDREHTAIQKRSVLGICPSDQVIAEDLEKIGGFSTDLGLYQIPPVDNFQELKITVEKGMIVGLDDKTLKEVCEEDDGETATLTTKRISTTRELDRRPDAVLTRVSNTSLGQLYAQHIFICFMWAIGSECNRRRTGKVLNQASLRTLARKVELTGIGDLDFANLALIPALSHYKLIEKQEFSPKTQDKLVGQ
jgi:hypothetical protein